MAKKRPKMSEADLESALEALKEEFEALTIEENQMAKSKSKPKTPGSVNRLSDKLVKVNENFTINMKKIKTYQTMKEWMSKDLLLILLELL